MNHFDVFYIPTVGRADRQLTYKNFPSSWKDRTVLVIQEKEKDLYPQYQTLVLPSNITTLAPTKQFIIAQATTKRYGILDDDLSFVKLRMDWEWPDKDITVPTKTKMLEKDFDAFEALVMDWMDRDEIVYCGMNTVWAFPIRNEVYQNYCRVSGNHFFNGPKFPYDEFDYTTFTTIEDYYLTLQMISKGIVPRVSHQFRIDPGTTQSAGGCANYRTLEMHNNDWRGLQAKYPQYITLKEKVAEDGIWKGMTKLSGSIQWKKFATDQPRPGNSLADLL